MTSIDTATATAVGLLWFTGFAVFYVWTAIALAAVFRKSGELGWKAWVPILNQIVLFRLGGMSPYLLLLYLFPGLGVLAVWVVQVIACHRINAEFGLGAGMTVAAALVFPVWASIVGFGSSRWVGEEAGPRRVGPGGFAAGSSYPPGLGAAPSDQGSAPAFQGRSTHVTPADPLFTTSTDAVAPRSPAPAQISPFAPAPPSSAADEGPVAPLAARSGSPVVPPVGGWAPPPVPPAQESHSAEPYPPEPLSSVPFAPSAPAPEQNPFAPASSSPLLEWADDATVDRPIRGRGMFDAPITSPPVSEDSEEVTGAVPNAPAPMSAVSAPSDAAPPVMRQPAPIPAPTPEPWAPSRSPLPENDAFPDTSGPVSAIAGAPDAGSPRSAMSSVSAQNRRPLIPEDPLEETIIARRRRTDWSLIPPGGEPIALGAEVVLLGRRPAIDPAHPTAQLIPIDDGTVSKTHARLELRGDKWYVTDLDSTNGVVFATLMGTEVEATPGVEIEAGDRFLLGDAEIRLVRSAE